MTLPTVQKTWSISACNRITYASLLDTASSVMYGVKNYLVATGGYTVKYTCDGTTGPTSSSDHTDRWASKTNAQTRATIVGAAQSFCVLTDGNGADILIAYQGATDDVFKVSFSPSGAFLPAGTANQQPTATDQQDFVPGTITAVGTNTSGDRLWSCWVDSTKKLFRVAVARAGAWVGLQWGVELVSSRVTSVSFSPAIWGFSFITGQQTAQSATGFSTSYAVNLRGGLARANATNIQCEGGLEIFAGVANNYGTTKTELQGSTGYPIFPLSIGSSTAGATGPVGDLYDWWLGRTASASPGDVYGSNQFIIMGSTGGVFWPWTGVAPPTMT
jgi:hypothetical protein